MGIRDQLAFNDTMRRKLDIVAEAARAGSTLVFADDAQSDLSVCRFSHGQARHVYGEQLEYQALAGIGVHPGEHHALLPCATPAAAVFMQDRRSWVSHDPALGALLQRMESTLGLASLDWNWKLRTGGHNYYRAEWCVQIHPIPDGTHLVVRGLQSQKLLDDSQPAGFAFFLRVASTLQHALQGLAHGASVPEPYATSFGAHADSLIHDEGAWIAPAVPVNASEAIRECLVPLAGDDVTFGELAPKRQKIAQSAFGTPVAPAPVLGVLGSAGFITQPRVLVLTPTHGYLHYRDSRAVFSWADLIDVQPEGHDSMDVLFQLDRLGWVPIPGCNRAGAVVDAFRKFIMRLPPE